MEISKEERVKNRNQIIRLLKATGREGIEDLIDYMNENGFFDAPCSGQYHLSCEGGLAKHSLNVFGYASEVLRALCKHIDPSLVPSDESIVLVSLLHDLGKIGAYGKPNYVVNMVKDGRPTKAEPEQKYKQSESKPYKTNPDLLYLPHSIRSASMASRFIDLTEDEEFAIICHDGLYADMKYVVSGHETPLYMILHFADLWCSRVIENEGKEGETE